MEVWRGLGSGGTDAMDGGSNLEEVLFKWQSRLGMSCG